MRWVWMARIAALLVVGFACLYRVGSPSLYQTDEGFMANRALSLFHHHSLLLTYDRPDEPQAMKPPLMYWAVAALYKLIGFNTWAVRLPTALAGVLLCLLVYGIARHHFGEWVGLVSGLVLCAVPYMLFHIRMALLDVPLLAAILLAVYTFAYAPPNPWTALLAGLACSAAVMIKGPAGFIAPPPPLLVGLLQRRPDTRFLVRALLLVAACLVPLAAYYLALPRDYAHTFLSHMFHNENSGAALRIRLSRRWPEFLVPLGLDLRWHLPAAAGGLFLLLTRVRRNPRHLEWLLLALLVAAPAVIGGLKMARVYTRYFLPAYPFLLTLSALFLVQVFSSRRTALLLLPFAAACLIVKRHALGWIPTGVALGLGLAAQFLPVAEKPRYRAILAAILVAGVAIPGLLAPAAWREYDLPERMQQQSDVARLATQAQDFVPPGERLLVAHDFKAHVAAFYSRRELISWTEWLLTQFKPGARGVALVRSDELAGIPDIRTTPLASSDGWDLLQIEIPADVTNAVAILVYCGHNLLTSRKTKLPVAETLTNLNIAFEEFDLGFVVRRIPNPREAVLPADRAGLTRIGRGGEGSPVSPPTVEAPLALQPGETLEIAPPPAAVCWGIDVRKAVRRATFQGLSLQISEDAGASWSTIREIREEFDDKLAVDRGRLTYTEERALRLRFDPVRAVRLRLVNGGTAPVSFQSVAVRLAIPETE